MEIANRFCAFINEYQLFATTDRVLLGVSGGRDSMLMLWLFHMQQIDIEVAHCNFQLRGVESDSEEEFVQAYCSKHAIPYHVRRFDTEKIAAERKISIQMAARELRYSWFEELATTHGCATIAVAQHKHDQVETVLLNLKRGTGLAGLQGILPKRGRIVRPLLFLDANEVSEAVKHYNIPYRDDSSNFSNKYARNKIRLDIVPQFEQIHPQFVDTMIDNIERFRDGYQVLQQLMDERRRQLFHNEGDGRYRVDKAALRNTDIAMLYYLFEPYGFAKPVLRDMLNALDQEPGRIFESPTYRILLDREQLLIQSVTADDVVPTYIYETETRSSWGDRQFTLDLTSSLEIVRDPNIAQLDHALLQFPLQIRSWQEGDYFQPLGMQGSKKLSDYFVQQKINLFDKKNIPIVVNANGDILWIAGYRIDDRYKITENTKKVLTIVCHKRGI